jgi:hypothetical protein
MINIEATQVISYGNNQSVTLYRDFTDTNTYYIVPEPVIPLNDSGLPEFALVSYTTGSEVTGTCSFQTELQVSDHALRAVRNKIGQGPTIGQFDWQSVKVIFSFATATDSALELIATPSMFGSNRASFIIHLPDNATYQAFVNAFGPNGSRSGTFMLEYDVTALTRLPPATVTVDFNSQTAYEYQRTVSVSRDTWGHVTSETVSITEHLQQSKAGTVTVDPGGQKLDPQTEKLLVQWGNDTLQNDVEQAVAAATQMMDSNTAPTFNMTAVASFHNVFVHGQIVPWIITPRAPIPAFSADVWNKVSSPVSVRPLKTAFTVQNLDRNGVTSIDVMVTYPIGSPSPAANNTHHFTSKAPSSWIFTAPGQSKAGIFDGRFSYHYVVHYTDGLSPFNSAEIESEETEIYISANDLNILALTFTADNVPFKKAGAAGGDLVDYLLVDMFFVNQTTGGPLALQQAKLDASNTSHQFQSRTHEPFSNPCSYKLTYVMTSGAQVLINWQTTTLAAPVKKGTSTAPVLHLNSPFQGKTITLFPLAPAGKKFEMAAISATYSDSVNKLNEQHDWSITDFAKSAEGWYFLAPANQNGQIVSFEGTYVIDGDPNTLQTTETSQSMFVLKPNEPLFSVTVDPSQIEWQAGKFTQVVVTLYTKDDKDNLTDVKTLIPFHSSNDLPQLYSYYFDASETPACFYKAEYWVKDQPAPALIAETALSATARLTLAGKPAAPALVAASRQAEAIVSKRAQAVRLAHALALR